MRTAQWSSFSRAASGSADRPRASGLSPSVSRIAGAEAVGARRRALATMDGGPPRQNVRVEGDDPALVAWLSEPLRAALAKRTSFYAIHIAAVGRVGEVLVSVDGSNGHVPLLFRTEELEAGYVCSVVLDTVQRYGI